MRAPRSIRGVLTNSVTGAPIAQAAIVVHSSGMPGAKPGSDVWGKTYSDSLGRYWIFNPPLGSFLLEIKCPPWRYRAGLVTDAPGEFLEPGENKVINRSIDGRLCNGPTRARRLQAGALESLEARASQYPSGDAAAVYRAALDYVYPNPWKVASSVVLSHMTSSACGDLTLCLAWLSGKEELDPSTADDFRRENQRSVPLRADFGYPHRVDLLTEDDRRYLEEQADYYDSTFGNSGDSDIPTFWRAFNESYPGARGWVTLSRVGFDRRRTEALVQVSYAKSPRGREGSTLLLRIDKGSWSVVSSF